MRRTLIAGNWKMNGNFAANRSLLSEVKAGLPADLHCDVLVCAPAPYFAQCADLLGGTAVSWGAQDVSVHTHGAYTGEISASMLQDCACKYAIVGHSERRAYFNETDEQLFQKAKLAIAEKLIPLFL